MTDALLVELVDSLSRVQGAAFRTFRAARYAEFCIAEFLAETGADHPALTSALQVLRDVHVEPSQDDVENS